MLVVYYIKCILVEVFTIIVMYDDGGLLHKDGGSILHEMCFIQRFSIIVQCLTM